MRVVGYTRVSTEEQEEDGVSLKVQADRIRAYCRAQAWKLTEIIEDTASAKNLRRPGLSRILDALPKRARPFDAILILKLDRLTRSVPDLGNLLARFKRTKVEFVSVEDSVNTATAAGELVVHILTSVAQWERRANGERTKAAMDHLRRQGLRISGHLPYGFKLRGRMLVPHPKEQRTLTLIRRLRRGRSLQAVSEALSQRGVLARSGKPFSPSTLHQILRRPRT